MSSIKPDPAARLRAEHHAKRRDKARQSDRRSAALRRTVSYLRTHGRSLSGDVLDAFLLEPDVHRHLGVRVKPEQVDRLVDIAADHMDRERDAVLAWFEEASSAPQWSRMSERQRLLFKIVCALALEVGPRVLLSNRVAQDILRSVGDATASHSHMDQPGQRLEALGLLEVHRGSRGQGVRGRSTVYDLSGHLELAAVLSDRHRAKLEADLLLLDQAYRSVGAVPPVGQLTSAASSSPWPAPASIQAWPGGSTDPVLDRLLAASSAPRLRYPM